MISVCNIFVMHPPRNIKQFWNLTFAVLGMTGGKYTRVFFVIYGINTQWMVLSPAQTFIHGFRWWTVGCGSVLDTFPVITLTNWTSWMAACRNVLKRLSMQCVVSVGTRQRVLGCQSSVPLTCTVAEVSYVAPTDRDRKTFWCKWQRAAFRFREIN